MHNIFNIENIMINNFKDLENVKILLNSHKARQ